MKTTNVTIPPLLIFSQGQWSGENNVIEHIEYFTHSLGILNYELYRKTLKEYRKNKDVYDMSRPFLLKFKIVALAKTCTQHNEITDSLLETIFDYRGASSMWIHYPVFPKEIIDTFKDLISRLSPYVFTDGKMMHDLSDQLLHRITINFYMYWDVYVRDPKAWVNYGIRMLKVLPYTNEQAAINEMQRAFESYGESTVNVSVPPKRSLYHKLKYLFK